MSEYNIYKDIASRTGGIFMKILPGAPAETST